MPTKLPFAFHPSGNHNMSDDDDTNGRNQQHFGDNSDDDYYCGLSQDDDDNDDDYIDHDVIDAEKQFYNDLSEVRTNDPSLYRFYCMTIGSDDYAEHLANALEGNTNLKNLILPIELREYKTCVMEKLASAIVNAKLTQLSLEWRTYCEGNTTHIASCLIGAAKRSPTIQHLKILPLEEAGGHFGEIVSCLPHLQSLSLEGKFIQGNVELLCKGLENTSTLTRLELSDTNIGSADDFRHLSQALAKNSSLTSLHFTHGKMDDDCVKAFVEHWHHDSQICMLAFIISGIKAEGAMLLIQAASSHPAMESLSIEGNESIGFDGLANIAMELPNVALKSLNLSACADAQNSDEEEAAVVVGDLIAKGVSANTHLVEIDVAYNGFHDDVKHAAKGVLAFYTLRNKHSPLMVLSELQLPASVWCHCFAKNCWNASFIFHFLREQSMLWHVSRMVKRQRTR